MFAGREVRVSAKSFLSDPFLKRAYNRKLFTVVAPRYRLATYGLSFFRDRAWKTFMVRQLPGAGNGDVIVDLACGTGDITRALAAAYPRALSIGVDFTPAMLRIAARRTMNPRMFLSVQDMAAMGVKTGAAGIVTGGYALRNAPDVSGVIAETSRMLKAGGTAAFLDFSKSPRPWLARLQCLSLILWGGVWGVLLHGRPSLYAYLGHSLAQYPTRPDLHARFEKAGLSVQRSIVIMFGFIEILIVQKRAVSA